MSIKLKRKSINLYISFLLVAIIIIISLQSIKTTYDNDLWWLLATGREILNNGFPKYNPWAIHDGMHIVVQQWIPSVILYSLYSLGDFPAIEIMLVILIAILFFVLWKLCCYCTGGKNKELVLLLILISFISLSTYFSSRPQIYTMIFYSLLILLLEKYRKTGETKYLYFLPLITMVHVNFHASMAPFDIFILLLYVSSGFMHFLVKKFSWKIELIDDEYNHRNLLIATIISCFTMLINPYGLKGALYLFESYGAASYRNFITEMGEMHIYSPSGIADLILIIITSAIIGKKGRNIDFPLTLLFLTTTFFSITHERNVWLVALFSMPLIARGLREYEIQIPYISWLYNKVVRVVYVFALLDFMVIYSYANIWPTLVDYINIHKSDSIDFPQQACDWLDEYSQKENIPKNEIHIFNNFNNGGLLEYRGFKVTMDPRPELWEPAITEVNEHYYQEFVDFMSGDADFSEYLDKYDFDFYLIHDGAVLDNYFRNNEEKYRIVKECNGYSVWTNN